MTWLATFEAMAERRVGQHACMAGEGSSHKGLIPASNF